MLIVQSDRGPLAAADVAAMGSICEELGAGDVAVPRARLVDLLTGMEQIAADTGTLVVCPGHIGDGNMHPTVVFDRADGAAAERAQVAFGAIMRLALELGGTITGEHGVGLLRRTWLREELGARSYALQQSIKSVFDPHGILNPGKML